MTERVVIVGGTSGIGLATAHRLAARGDEVVVAGRNQDRLDAAVAALSTSGSGSARGVRLDATDADAVTEFFTGLGEVDHVVITATGAGGLAPFRELDAAAVREHVDGKLVAHWTTARAALAAVREGGSLTFLTAASAGGAMAGTAALAAVNAAIEAIVPVLAVELAPTRVNAVSPGVIDTPWWDWMPAEAREQTFAQLAAATPAGRVGTAEDVASAIGYLIDNTFTTGIVLPVNGGATLRAAG